MSTPATPPNDAPQAALDDEHVQAAAPSQRGTFGLFIGGTALALVLAVGAILIFGGKDEPPLPSEPQAFELKGHFALMKSATGAAVKGECEGYRGYDDIAEGSQVTVYNASGKAVALGVLKDSDYVGGVCSFRFAVPEVPAGDEIYQVEVTHRGKISFSDEAARKGDVSLTLG
ncbi:hypothetical protein ACFFQW_05115 [Umezawaea endophytica]|uniref:Uncharacterized protein n=1 Tax=Umezawaea endophytica TaxID=1654476 RepID=A0A9X2ZZU2_9PSEU|nr:hypothetical protein [Umezawaea endophytica]MCS7476248.1 hypothetical protein [Umezawaea endophytica]